MRPDDAWRRRLRMWQSRLFGRMDAADAGCGRLMSNEADTLLAQGALNLTHRRVKFDIQNS